MKIDIIRKAKEKGIHFRELHAGDVFFLPNGEVPLMKSNCFEIKPTVYNCINLNYGNWHYIREEQYVIKPLEIKVEILLP